jgi:hypothetical protein
MFRRIVCAAELVCTLIVIMFQTPFVMVIRKIGHRLQYSMATRIQETTRGFHLFSRFRTFFWFIAGNRGGFEGDCVT